MGLKVDSTTVYNHIWYEISSPHFESDNTVNANPNMEPNHIKVKGSRYVHFLHPSWLKLTLKVIVKLIIFK